MRRAIAGPVLAGGAVLPAGGPGLATGVRVGEVGPESAIVWVRLTREPARRSDGKRWDDVPAPRGGGEGRGQPRRGRSLELPEGWQVEDLEGACPGAPGLARVLYAPREDLEGATATPWQKAEAERDYVIQFRLRGLRPGTRYHYRVETRSLQGEPGATFTGSFRTAPPSDQAARVTFTVVTGMMYRDLDHPEGFHIYAAMAKLRPDFFVATGDTVYYDNEWPRARTVALARYHWHRMYSLPRIVEFHRHVPGYWMKDDHDTLDNDCWPGKPNPANAPLTFEEGRKIFLEEVPMGGRTYRRARWGRHLEVWFVEGRDFRSPNPAPDGPGKTIWGEEQKRWLKKTLLESDATFRILVSPTPILGPDRPRGKRDNHSNAAFRHEGEGFRRWAREHLPDRFYIICGDRHWQYQSVDPETGLVEFSCGPASDRHAGGSPGFDPSYHRFHRVKGGFLSVTVGEEGGRPAITFRFHDVHGGVVGEYREVALEAEACTVPEVAEEGTPPGRLLYARLLEEARGHLRRRAETVAALLDPESIRARAAAFRRFFEDSLGGLPERTPLDARVTGRLERRDHTVEKVVYESRPGFHVTANLYLPKRGTPPYPVVLFPCGHASSGKAGPMYQAGVVPVAVEI